jgi:hypothetical protein
VKNLSWIAASVFWLIAALLSSGAAMMSFMMFDAPGSTSSVPTIVLFACVLTLPLFCLAGAILPWLFRSRRSAKWLFLIPFIDAGAIVAMFGFLQLFCGGNFTCR